MKKYFITYGDDAFYLSRKQLAKQAQKSGLFDEVIVYTPKDLSDSIKASPLMAYKRGGGYWVWKPYVIFQTLNLCQEGDIVVYADAGCTINASSEEWNLWFHYLETYNAIFFQYKSIDHYPDWQMFCKDKRFWSTEIKYWTKQETLNFFENYVGNDAFMTFRKILGGCILVKKCKANLIIDEWLRINLFHPELVIDPSEKEMVNQYEFYIAHRHDQSIITPLVYYWKDSQKLMVLPESQETDPLHAAIAASRVRHRNPYTGLGFLRRVKVFLKLHLSFLKRH